MFKELSAARIGSAAAAVEELVLVTIADAPREDEGLADQIASLGPRLQDPPISILSSDALMAVDVDSTEQVQDDSIPVAPTAGDPALRALMWGRYTGQISARIERAWNDRARRSTTRFKRQRVMPAAPAQQRMRPFGAEFRFGRTLG